MGYNPVTFFLGWGMQQTRKDELFAAEAAPRLLLQLPPWHRVFLGNLADLLLRRRPRLPVMTSRPAPFWADVFTPTALPLRGFRQSLLYHAFIVTAIWGLSQTWLSRPRPQPRDAFQHTTITYYRVDDYLPPLASPAEVPRRERVGAPAYARQRITSLRLAPDNRHQTIISPPAVKLDRDVPLPNMVVWTPVAPPVPVVAAQHSLAQLTLPSAPVSVVPPAPDPRRNLAQLRQPGLEANVFVPAPSANSLRLKSPPAPAPAVVTPAPAPNAHLHLPEGPVPAVIAPAPALNQFARRPGDVNIGRLDPRITPPRMPEPPTIPAAAPLQGSASGETTGQFIALSLNPATIAGPIALPAGNRAGEFMATPEGVPGAPGTPDIRAGKGSDEGAPATGPAGITISGGNAAPAIGAVVARPPAASNPASAAARQVLLAAIRPLHVADIGRATRSLVNEPTRVAGEVFGPKHYYTMVVNSPNLTSMRGTWIVRFAELHQDTSRGPVTAPVATVQVDPSYPTELLRSRVEGTVTLYAVIRSDGTVSEVRVLKGVDQRLDENARIALSRWRFRPATKNGNPIDLEAVVQVPFLSSRVGD